MILIIELMEKKTPSIKNTNRKKGMTLVEVMAAMAILSILFVGISGLMINIVKSENRAEQKLEINNYIKSALVLFDSKSVNVEKYKDGKTILFDDLNEMQSKIISGDESGTGKYSIYIISSPKDNDFYKVTAHIKSKNVEDIKMIIVNK